MLRDTLADADYFTQLITIEERYIQEDREDILQNMDALGERAWNIASCLVDNQFLCANIAYSRGDLIGEVHKRTMSAFNDMEYLIKVYKKYPKRVWGSSYLTAFAYLHYSVLYDPRPEQIQTIVNSAQHSYRNPDPLLDAMINYLTGKPIDTTPELADIKYAKSLGCKYLWEAICYGRDGSESLKKYIEGWYRHNTKTPYGPGQGIGAHKKMIRYQGYWSWEAAAVAVMMDIDDTQFRDHEHYPKDLVEWVRNKKSKNV